MGNVEHADVPQREMATARHVHSPHQPLSDQSNECNIAMPSGFVKYKHNKQRSISSIPTPVVEAPASIGQQKMRVQARLVRWARHSKAKDSEREARLQL
jgi:hypothetical protein